ncbi:MAG: LEPR-XLL domain-containing protein, partial [Fuerstiella sp.]
MPLRNFIRQTRLLLSQSLYEARRAMTTPDDWPARSLQVTQLEERILMSASPLAVVAEAQDAGAS